MKEIVDRILREEQTARERIQTAKKEAEELLQKAKKDAAVMVSDADADLARLIEQKRQAAIDEYNASKESEILQTRQSVTAQYEARKNDVPALVDKVFKQVTALP